MSQPIEYSSQILKQTVVKSKTISHFEIDNENIDNITVASFGDEWEKFDSFSDDEIKNVGLEYFDIVDLEQMKEYHVLDIGCGTGRWSKFLAPYVKHIDAIDPSKAIFSAANLLSEDNNVRLSQASVSNLPFEDDSFDFVFSLGVLHHIPDTQKAMIDAVKKVKKGGSFLVYLYYSLDNKGIIFKFIFRCSTVLRFIISKLPTKIKALTCDLIAFSIYLPFIYVGKFLKFIFPKSNLYTKIPLSYYINKSLNIIRNDALDRFGTPLEQRFSKIQIEEMMKKSGLSEIVFSSATPHWHAVGKKI